MAPSCGASARRVAAELAAFVPRRSPAFYILRSSSALAADVAVDGMRVAYGTLSKHAFRQNALLKLLKHGLSCACCIAAGAPQGLRGAALALALRPRPPPSPSPSPPPSPSPSPPPSLPPSACRPPPAAPATRRALADEAHCVVAGCLLPMTLGVQSHLFFIISDLVRRPLHAACALALPSPAWQPPRAPAAPRPTPALAPRLRVDAAARVGGGGGGGGGSEFSQPLACRRPSPPSPRLAVPLQTKSCHSSVAPSREVKSPVSLLDSASKCQVPALEESRGAPPPCKPCVCAVQL